MFFRNLLRISVLVLLMGFLLQPAPAQSSADKEGLAKVELPDELAGVLRGYEAAWSKRDAEGLANLFTEDGFVLRRGHPPAHGREAIQKAYENSGGPLALWAYAYETEGSVGYIVGGYSGDPESPAVGKFVLALRKDESGKWLIAADMDNGNH